MWKVLLSNNHQSSLVVKPHFLAIHQKKRNSIFHWNFRQRKHINLNFLWFLESFNSTFRYLRREKVKYNLSGEPIANIQIGTTFLLNFLNLKTGNDARARFKIFFADHKGPRLWAFFPYLHYCTEKTANIFSFRYLLHLASS